MERNERYEINSKGEVVVGIPVTLKPSERKAMIEKMFSINGWKYTLMEEITSVHYLIQVDNDNLNLHRTFHLFHGNVRKEDPERSRDEKKIQLGTDNDPRQYPDDGVILGFYVYENKQELADTVVVAWPIEENKNYPANPSLRVNMRNDIMPAKNTGFYVDSSTGKNLVVFRPEFIYLYLEKYKALQYENTLTSYDGEEFDKEKAYGQLMLFENKDFIFSCLDLMKKKNLFNDANLSVLQSKEECAVRFKHNSANGILYKIDKSKSEEDQNIQKQGADGRSRYYHDRYAIDNDEYFVSSEWKPVTDDENPREYFIKWIFTLMDGLKFYTGLVSKYSRNRILFGAPGTGKSFTVNQDRKELLGEENESDYERVTFHPDYSYANFVGTYKPVMVKNQNTVLFDRDTQYVLSVLNDKSKNAQEKYDLLFDRFKEEGLTRLPALLGLYTDEPFETRKLDGSAAVGNNGVERNHGRALRKYVNLVTGHEKSSDIAYEYVPGAFMRVYVNALKNARTGRPRPYLLIIEEINRANVAAVFGDIFQLLDRGDDGVSEYPIQASEDVKNYLAKELGGEPGDYSQIRIPDNMFIWATMNSADQGVFPMDTAFKRRWDFTYLGIDDSDKDIRGKYVEVGKKERQRVEWNELRKSINEFLADEKINEDKQLGPYFVPRNIVVPVDGGDEIDSERFCNVFKHKVLMYLFEDAAKQKRTKLFEGSAKGQTRYSKICEAFDEQGIGIFHPDIQNRVRIKDIKTNGYALDENGIVKTKE